MTPPPVANELAYQTEIVERCDLCGSALRQDWRIPGIEKVSIIRCVSCGLVLTSPRPTRDSIHACYPATYAPHVEQTSGLVRQFIDKIKIYKGGYPVEDGTVMAMLWSGLARLFGGFFSCVVPWPGGGRRGEKRLLDVGCGSGRVLQWARRVGWEVHGLELDSGAVAVARSLNLLEVREGTLEANRYLPAFFDAVTMFHVLEHLHSPSSALRECRRILRDDGLCLVVVPNFRSRPRLVLGEFWQNLDLPRHLYHFEEATLRRLADDCGFEVAEVRYSAILTTTAVNLLSTIRTVAWMKRNVPSFSAGRFWIKIVQGLLRPSDDETFVIGDVMALYLRPKFGGSVGQ